MKLSLSVLTFSKAGSKYVYQSILNRRPSTGPQMDLGEDARGYVYINAEFVVTEATVSVINVSGGL